MRMQVATRTKRALLLGCLGFLACAGHKFERRFIFGVPARERVDRLRQYSLEDQFSIFRYGNDHIEPPLMDLAGPIAEKGQAVVPFLLGKLDPNADDMTVRDVLFVFYMMASMKYYDVKSDAPAMEKLRSRVSAMKDARWKANCLDTLRRIEAD